MSGLHIIFFGCIISVFANSAKARLSAESIVAGDPSEPHEFPYQIALLNNGTQMCGGGIINEQFVLTAAHCVINENDNFNAILWTVVAGVNDLYEESDTRVEVGVEKAYVPTLYDGRTMKYLGDIAVLKLTDKLNLGQDSGLAKLNLPANTKHNLNESNFLVHSDAMVAGFGWEKVVIDLENIVHIEDFEIKGSSSGKLMKLKLKVISNEDCQKINRRPIKNTKICATVVERDYDVPQGICSGDSGSPLVHDGVVIGVVSVSTMNCDDRGHPAIFTRVSAFIDLIENAMKDYVSGTMRYHEYY